MGVTTAAFLVILGFVPSLVWLGFYLKKDLHPEPKYLISRTFLMGIVMAPLAVALQWWFRWLVLYLWPGYAIQTSVWFFLWAAAIEEIIKFFAVYLVAIRDQEFDEPMDAMIYMISAALGFAAIENILVLFQIIPNGANATAQIWLLRFVGATLLHAVASATVGYFLALAWFYSHHCRKLISFGISIATLLHLVFNVILLGGNAKPVGFVFSMVFLILVASIISVLFAKLKRMETGVVDNNPHLP